MTIRDRRIAIAGVGEFRPTYDRVTICTNVPKSELDVALPKAELKANSHVFELENIRGKRGCRINVTCLPDRRALTLLRRYERYLGQYRVTTVEITADSFGCGDDETQAKRNRDALLKIANKYNHQRGYIRAIDCDRYGNRPTQKQAERRGLIANDFTVYFEPTEETENGNRNPPAMDLRIYIRREKLAAGQFGDIGVRLEFKLSRARAVRTCIGGDQLDDLVKADLTTIIENNLILEQVDYAKLGRLLSPQTVRPPGRGGQSRSRAARQMNDEEYRAKRVAHLAIKVLESRYGLGSGPMRDDVRQSSPAQIQGIFRRYLKKQAARPSRLRRRNGLTMKKLEACFTRIPIETARY